MTRSRSQSSATEHWYQSSETIGKSSWCNECTTGNHQHVLSHLILTSCVADIPECEDLLFVRWGTNTFSPCHKWLVSRQDFGQNRRATKRRLTRYYGLLSTLNIWSSFAKGNVVKLIILTNPPFLHRFSLVRGHSSAATYAVFLSKPLHNFFLGLSRTWKECLYRYLSNPKTLLLPRRIIQEAQNHFRQLESLYLRGSTHFFMKQSRKYSELKHEFISQKELVVDD